MTDEILTALTELLARMEEGDEQLDTSDIPDDEQFRTGFRLGAVRMNAVNRQEVDQLFQLAVTQREREAMGDDGCSLSRKELIELMRNVIRGSWSVTELQEAIGELK